MATMIEVDNLGKSYRLGGQDRYYRTLRESLMRGIKRPFQKFAGCSSEDEFWALRNVSFSVEEGEVVGIIGRNGAGKSTLLKLLGRITRPTEGRADLYGRVGSLLEVGTGFHPELTGRENIFLAGNLLGMKRTEVRDAFDAIVDFSGVEKFLDTPVKHFSSGMYARLGFAIAAHLNPEILLVDEVLAVGDAEFQKKCLGKMGEVARAGRTVLFVSHNMGFIAGITSKAVLLRGGKTEFFGDSKEALRRYMAESGSRLQAQELRASGFYSVSMEVDGKEVIHVVTGDAAEIILNIFVDDKTDGEVSAGITLYDSLGRALFSSGSLDTFKHLQPGFNAYSLRLPSEFLLPGEYRIEGAVWNGRGILDRSDNLFHFTASSGNMGGQESLGYRAGLRIPYPWRIVSTGDERGGK